jgi:hypothetical protein
LSPSLFEDLVPGQGHWHQNKHFPKAVPLSHGVLVKKELVISILQLVTAKLGFNLFRLFRPLFHRGRATLLAAT